MICAAAWAALWDTPVFCTEKQGPLSFIKPLHFTVLPSPLFSFGAYGLVNLYNIMQDSSVHSREFSVSADVRLLHDRPSSPGSPLYPAAYMGVLLLFFYCSCLGHLLHEMLSHLCPLEPPVLPAFSFFLSVMSLWTAHVFYEPPCLPQPGCLSSAGVLFLCILAACTLPQLRKFSFSKLFEHSFAQLGKISFAPYPVCPARADT